MPLHIGPTDQGFRLEGELDLATSQDLLTAIRERPIADDPLTLDFSDITFMDSSGLRALLEAAKSRGGDHLLVILDPSPQVRRVLDISLPEGAPGLEIRAGEGGRA
jgi:anti-anti-sigma factor